MGAPPVYLQTIIGAATDPAYATDATPAYATHVIFALLLETDENGFPVPPWVFLPFEESFQAWNEQDSARFLPWLVNPFNPWFCHSHPGLLPTALGPRSIFPGRGELFYYVTSH